MYVEYWEKCNINNKIKLPRTMFLEKYGNLVLYDEDPEKIFIIDHEEQQFGKKYVWTLIVIPKKTDGSLSDHDYFCIHDILFERIQ